MAYTLQKIEDKLLAAKAFVAVEQAVNGAGSRFNNAFAGYRCFVWKYVNSKAYIRAYDALDELGVPHDGLRIKVDLDFSVAKHVRALQATGQL